MNRIKITTKLSFAEFIKVNFYLTYRKWVITTITILSFISLFTLPFYDKIYGDFPRTEFIMVLVFTVVIPFSIFYRARRAYATNSRMGETINYEFDEKNIYVIGESFNATLSWDKIYSVTESKNWVLIWQNRLVANIIPKKTFSTEALNAFKILVAGHQTIQNKLK